MIHVTSETDNGVSRRGFGSPKTAAAFLSLRKKDGTEYTVTWPNGDSEVWLYDSPVFEDQEHGEYKCSPHGEEGDFDEDCYWTTATYEDVLDSVCRT